jgi:phosphorylcholine metabolism protein LicD
MQSCATLTCSHSKFCTTKNTSCCVYVLKTALNFLDTFFQKHNITYVIIYGTLLGAIRNGTVIPWTHDIDIGLFNKRTLYSNEIRDELYKHGYHLFEVSEVSYFLSILIKKSIFLDIN